MAAKIPLHMKKFTGDNTQNWIHWITQFEAHYSAVDVGAGKKLPTLLCCLENTAFTLVSNLIIADAATTYDQAKDVLKTRFCGEEYKRILQVKLQSLKFVKGMNINSFIDELMCHDQKFIFFGRCRNR